MEAATPPQLRRLVVGTDFGASADDALDRALRLPWVNHGGELCLLHATRERNRVESAARLRRTAIVAQHLAEDLGVTLTVRARLERGSVAGVLASYAGSWSADLVVVGRSRPSAVRDLFGRSTAWQLVRRSVVAVLVVNRSPAGPYARPLVAMDLERGSESLLAVAACVVGPDAAVRVLHVVDDPLGKFASTNRAAHQRRAVLRARSVVDVRRVVDAYAASLGPGLHTVIESGDPKATIAAEVESGHPDLVVVGTRGRSTLSRAFFGSLAESMLDRPRSDVLIAPRSRRADSSMYSPNRSAIAVS